MLVIITVILATTTRLREGVRDPTSRQTMVRAVDRECHSWIGQRLQVDRPRVGASPPTSLVESGGRWPIVSLLRTTGGAQLDQARDSRAPQASWDPSTAVPKSFVGCSCVCRFPWRMGILEKNEETLFLCFFVREPCFFEPCFFVRTVMKRDIVRVA